MDDQTIADIAALLAMCRREKAWPGPRKAIEEIEARYRDGIAAMHKRQMIAGGWTRQGNTWSKVA